MNYTVSQLSDYDEPIRQQAREVWREHQRRVLMEEDTSVYVYARIYPEGARYEYGYGYSMPVDEWESGGVTEVWENGGLVVRHKVTCPITVLVETGVGDWDQIGDYTYDEEANRYIPQDDHDEKVGYTLEDCIEIKLDEMEEAITDELLASICAAIMAMQAYAKRGKVQQ